MGVLLPIIYFSMYNALFVFFFKKKFGKCLPLTFVSAPLILLLCWAIFGNFKVGYFICNIIPLLSILLVLLNIKNKEKLMEFKNNFLTLGLGAFIVLNIIVFIHDYNRSFIVWDELSHWGMHLKELLRLNTMYTSSLSNAYVHQDYPPAFQLFEMLFVRISGGFSEVRTLRAVHIFEFSLFIPAICELSYEVNLKNQKLVLIIKNIFLKYCEAISILIIAFLMFLTFDGHGIINTIYVDYPMVILTAYCLYFVLSEENPISVFGIINLCMSFSFLVLMKQICITFYAMILFLLGLIIVRKMLKKEIKLKKVLFPIILLIVVPISIWYGWEKYVTYKDFSRQFRISNIKIQEVYGIIKKTKGKDYQQETANKYIQSLASSSITTSYIKLNYIQLSIISIAFLFLIMKWENDKYRGYIRISAIITMILGVLGYAFVMLLSYISSFSVRESTHLASFNRYMPSFILIILSVDLMLFILVMKKKQKNYIYILLLILFSVQSPDVFERLYTPINKNPDSIYKQHSDVIMSKIPSGSKIYIVSQDTVGDYQQMMNYYTDGMYTNKGLGTFNLEDSKEKERVSSSSYLYIAKINSDFISKYGSMFDQKIITEGQIYIINKDDGNFKFILI